MNVIKPVDDEGSDFGFFCPGCQCGHGFNSGKYPEPKWTFNGDLVKPTITPSIRLRGYIGKRDIDGVKVYGTCHSTVTDGLITFHKDSTHLLAGQRVSLPVID